MQSRPTGKGRQSQPELTAPPAAAANARRRVRLVAWPVGLALVALQCWIARHDVMLDGIAYLDLARAAAAGNMGALINGCWGPGYPALLALAMRLFRPAPL